MPTISDTWDDPFETQLKDGTFISGGDNIIRSTRRATEERLGREHDLNLSDQSDHGRHPQMSQRAFLTKSANRPDGETHGAADVGRIAISGGDIWVWNGAAYVEAKSRYLASSIFEIHSPDGISDSLVLWAARWLDEMNLGATGIISCQFEHWSGSTNNIRTRGGYITWSSGDYTLKGVTDTGNDIYYNFDRNTFDTWRRIWAWSPNPTFHMVIQG